MPRSSKRVAFVVQRYGKEVSGGAELLCRLWAERLKSTLRVEILTTCARDYLTWDNHYPPGCVSVNGVLVRRFRVDHPRDLGDFQSMSERVLRGEHAACEEEEWMKAQGPYSRDLIDYVQRKAGRYDLFVFVTYLYATTYYCLPFVAEKAVLVPTAHNERPIHLGIFDRVFSWPRRLLLSTEEEMRFVRRRFGSPADKLAVVGVGLDTSGLGGTDPGWRKLENRLPKAAAKAIYVGRLDESKGCHTLLDYCARFREERRQNDLQLLLVGRGTVETPPGSFVHRTGFVSNEFKFQALRHSDVLIVPSAYESLSLVTLEAWHLGKPVLVNADSPVLQGHCRRSDGGLWYRDYAEFREALAWLLSHREEARRMGERGQLYMRSQFNWPTVENRFREAVAPIMEY